MLEAGLDLYSLQQWLGHRYISTTMRYLHLARPDQPDGARAQRMALLDALPPGPAPAGDASAPSTVTATTPAATPGATPGATAAASNTTAH